MPAASTTDRLHGELRAFDAFGTRTRQIDFPNPAFELPVYVNEFWTAKQRAAHALHEISYRACFKPQLPRFFIERLTAPGDRVYDPFMGRGTTLLEAALLDRVPVGCDVNPLARRLIEPRLNPPTLAQIAERLAELDLDAEASTATAATAAVPDEDLLVFFHPRTLHELAGLRAYLARRLAARAHDATDAWIRMVATNRLTGHSPGFFSVYTLPPNQATSATAQRRINAKRNQSPDYRDVRALILRKSRTLLNGLHADTHAQLQRAASAAQIITASADRTPQIADASIALVVTSPPFLDVVNYRQDNWLRLWFNAIDRDAIGIWQCSNAADWQEKMTAVFRELARVLAPGGHVAFEVGEVHKGKVLMETLVVPAAHAAGLAPQLVLVNDQRFTKTAHCWGVGNLAGGTNTNRIVVLRKD